MLTIENQPVEITKFPDGTSKFTCESFLKAISIAKTDTIVVKWLYDDDSELFQLQCIVDWLRSNGYNNIALHLPYVPNARMDRVPNNEMFTLKSFANFINSMNFTYVKTLDIHSNVGAALIDRIYNDSPEYYIYTILQDHLSDGNLVLFFPDEGAMKRYSPIANKFHLPYGFGMKCRDWQTGIIKGLDILGNTESLAEKDVLIIDDICSRGGTFYYSAQALKKYNVNNIYLYVSHLENAVHEGQMIDSGLIKTVYTTDSIYRKDQAPDNHKDKIVIVDSFMQYQQES